MQSLMSLIESRKFIYKQLSDDISYAIASGDEIVLFNCPVFENVADHVFKLTGHVEEKRSLDDAKNYLLNLENKINQLEFNESMSSIAEELGID